MARVGIVFGLLLCGLSALGMSATVVKDPVQFLPLMLGIPILFGGVVALNPHRRRIAMQSATAIGLVGILIGSAQAANLGFQWSDGETVSDISWKLIATMTWLCATFVIICLIVLVREHRRRQTSIISKSSPGGESSQSMVCLPPNSETLSIQSEPNRSSTGQDVA
ncbi:hypothetical protein [Rubripirellula reticaptiva]|uniref:Transmembrane protein n=1 Tax=Rubripirellula reticaptiva TaxID=2528013 RepID=A0A5C6EL59_9BACT|nr:hypothetical protein [Rubripirellula reticaptiva]TWU48321.1 hypothetical protein Poly59_51670 [Rubripirellula reticaptiva]